jgi:hypothetical protein
LRNIDGLSGDTNTTENPLVNLASGSGFGTFMSGQKRMVTFATIGSLYGFYRAYQGNKKIGGYIGNALLFSLIGYAAGYLSLKVVPPKSNAIVTQGGTNSFSNDGEFKNAIDTGRCNCKIQIPITKIAINAKHAGYYIIAYVERYGKKAEGMSVCVPNNICGSKRFELNPPIYVPDGTLPPISFG